MFNSLNNEKIPNQTFIKLILSLTLSIILLFNFFAYIRYIDKILHCSYPAEYGEGVVYNHCFRMMNNQVLYKSINDEPYIHVPYTPLYYIIASSLMKLISSSPQVCRLLSILSAFGIAVIVFVLIHKKTKLMLPSLFLSLFLFASPFFFEWSPLIRVDSLGILLALLGLFIASPQIKFKHSIYFSIPFFIAGIMTKQTLFAAPISVFLYLLFNDKKKAAKFILALLLSLIVLFGLIQYITNGNFYLNIIKYNVIPFDLSAALMAIGITLTSYYGIVGLSMLNFGFSIKDNKLEPVSFYLIISLISSLSIGKVGAAGNHLMEFIIALTLNAGYSYDQLKNKFQKAQDNLNLSPILPVVLLLMQVISLHFIDTSITNNISQITIGSKTKPLAWTPYNQSEVPEYDKLDKNQYEVIAKYLHSVPGLVLCDNVGLLAMNGKQVYFQPFQYKYLAQKGLWDETRIIDKIKNGKFSLIIMTRKSVVDGKSWLYNDNVLKAIWDNYAVIKSVGQYDIYGYLGGLTGNINAK
jgi:hypothetical protein